MLPEERQQRILRALEERSPLRASELASLLGVSVETIRRDLLALDHSGQLRRVYGGAARSKTRSTEPPYESRRSLNHPANLGMARLAVSLVQPQETLILDVGTSVLEVARALPPHYRGRVLTNSLLGVQILVAEVPVDAGDAQAGERTAAAGR